MKWNLEKNVIKTWKKERQKTRWSEPMQKDISKINKFKRGEIGNVKLAVAQISSNG